MKKNKNTEPYHFEWKTEPSLHWLVPVLIVLVPALIMGLMAGMK